MDPRFDPAGGSATTRRDNDLRVLARTRKAIVIVSLGAVAALAGVVAQVKPGRSSASSSAPSGSDGSTGSAAVTGSVTRPLPPLSSADVGSSSGSSLSPPPEAPAAAPVPAPAPASPVVSGGS